MISTKRRRGPCALISRHAASEDRPGVADALIQLVVFFLQRLLHSYDYENYRRALNYHYTHAYARVKKF